MRAAVAAAALALAAGITTSPIQVALEAVPAALYAEYQVSGGETLLDVARDHGLGYVEILAANPGIDPWLPPAGRTIVLPTTHLEPDVRRRGIVVNLGDMRLFLYRRPGEDPLTFPIGIGRAGWNLRAADTSVAGKRHWPVWRVPASIREEHPDLPEVVPAGPDNPLGEFALDLRLPGIAIHGTNKPYGVGRRVSHGCIRLYPEDIAELFPMVPVGTPVTVVDQPAKLAWLLGHLWLEVHPAGDQADQVEERVPPSFQPVDGLEDTIIHMAAGRADAVDWEVVRRTVAERRGVPVRITRPAP